MQTTAVVVGVDGSRDALAAVLWAVDEAADRGLPLRLVHATGPGADGLAGERIVRRAVHSIAGTAAERRVPLDVELRRGRPSTVLHDAGRSAAMVCVGALGLRRATTGSVGSTAVALASSAHCPVAIVRGRAGVRASGRIVAELVRGPDDDLVLERAVAEAVLRKAPLEVIASETDLRRRLARMTSNTHLDVRAVTIRGPLRDYLIREGDAIQLAVVGSGRAHGVAALQSSGCSVLVCNPHAPL